jgi:hypothetical protein
MIQPNILPLSIRFAIANGTTPKMKWQTIDTALKNHETRGACLAWIKAHENLSKFDPEVRQLEFTAKRIENDAAHGKKLKIPLFITNKITLNFYKIFDFLRLTTEKTTNIAQAECELFCNGAISPQHYFSRFRAFNKSPSFIQKFLSDAKNRASLISALQAMETLDSKQILEFLTIGKESKRPSLMILSMIHINDLKDPINNLLKKLSQEDYDKLMAATNIRKKDQA